MREALPYVQSFRRQILKVVEKVDNSSYAFGAYHLTGQSARFNGTASATFMGCSTKLLFADGQAKERAPTLSQAHLRQDAALQRNQADKASCSSHADETNLAGYDTSS